MPLAAAAIAPRKARRDGARPLVAAVAVAVVIRLPRGDPVRLLPDGIVPRDLNGQAGR